MFWACLEYEDVISDSRNVEANIKVSGVGCRVQGTGVLDQSNKPDYVRVCWTRRFVGLRVA